MISNTPEPPYYAVIFTSLARTDRDEQEYGEMAMRMVQLAMQQPGFLGIESARNGLGITVSYWASLEAISAWKSHAEHMVAQQRGYRDWYACFKTRIAKVERDYGFTHE